MRPTGPFAVRLRTPLTVDLLGPSSEHDARQAAIEEVGFHDFSCQDTTDTQTWHRPLTVDTLAGWAISHRHMLDD